MNEWENKIICGDNLEILKKMPDEFIDLCYIDPPFFTSKTYEVIWNDGAEIRAFEDRWVKMGETGRYTKDLNVYLAFMEPRIKEIYRVLKKTGSFYLHCDWHANAYLRVLCDQIFGYDKFRTEIIWQRSKGHSLAKGFDIVTDTILLYTKSNEYIYNQQYNCNLDLDKRFPYIEKETGRRFNHYTLEKSSNIKNNDKVRIIQGKKVETNLGWVWTQETFDKKIKENPYIIYWTENGRPRYKLYADEYKGKKISNLWDDIPMVSSTSKERMGYPTQKPESLLTRIIKTSSNEGDIVLDAFCGCGTTLAVAKRMNRRFIGIDISPTACRLMAKRIGYNIHEVIGLPMTTDEIANLSGYEFQNVVLQFFSSYNPEAVKFGQIGVDGGVDGWYYDAIIQVKKSKISINHIKELEATMYSKNVKYGFLVGLEISSVVVKEAARVKTCNMPLSIYLFTYDDLIEKKHVDAMIEINKKHNKVM